MPEVGGVGTKSHAEFIVDYSIWFSSGVVPLKRIDRLPVPLGEGIVGVPRPQANEHLVGLTEEDVDVQNL